MAITNFIPEVWSPRILENIRTSLVFGGPSIVNRDYEGEIRNAGDTVRINSIGALTVGSYTQNTDISSPEVLSDDTRSLVIDQSRYTNFTLDDVDRAQANANLMDAAMRQAGYDLAKDMDGYLAGLMADEATDITGDITDATPSAESAYEDLVDLMTALDEADCPRDGRFVVVSPAFHGLLLRDNRFVDASRSGSTDALRNGRAGNAAGFDIFTSNQVPAGGAEGTKAILAGHRQATTVAEQVNKVEAYRLEARFADAVKVLMVYGAKVIRPEFLVKADLTV